MFSILQILQYRLLFIRGEKKSFYSIVVRSSGLFIACGFHPVILFFSFLWLYYMIGATE